MGELFDTDEPGENATIFVDGDDITIDEGATAAEVRGMVGASDDEQATFRNEDNKPVYINDDERILDYLNPGDELSFTPSKGDVFG